LEAFGLKAVNGLKVVAINPKGEVPRAFIFGKGQNPLKKCFQKDGSGYPFRMGDEMPDLGHGNPNNFAIPGQRHIAHKPEDRPPVPQGKDTISLFLGLLAKDPRLVRLRDEAVVSVIVIRVAGDQWLKA